MKKFISTELSGNSHNNYDELERHIVSRIQNFELSNVDPIFNEENNSFDVTTSWSHYKLKNIFTGIYAPQNIGAPQM